MATSTLRPWHAVLLALLGVVVTAVLIPGRAQRAEPADVLLALQAARGPVLPAPGRAGAASATPVARYGRETLADVIDGAAEAYLARGFTAAAFATYAFEAPGARPLEVAAEAHRFETETGAEAQALDERPPRAAPLPGLPGAVSDGSVLVARAGRDLLKLTSLSTGPGGADALAALASAWRKERAMSGDERRMGRREALIRISQAALAGAAVVGGAGLLLDRRVARADGLAIPDWRVAVTGPAARAVAARGDDPARNVARALAALGGMDRFVRRGETVLVKPNVGWDRLPEQAANTDPEVVAEIVRQCRAAGATRVVVADISCNDPQRCFARSGVLARAQAAGAEVLDARQLKLVPAGLTGNAAGLEVIAPLLEVQPGHQRAGGQAPRAVAGHAGDEELDRRAGQGAQPAPPGDRPLHRRAGAPSSGPPSPSSTPPACCSATARRAAASTTSGRSGAICAGVDPVLLEVWGAAQLGLKPADLPFIGDAERRGLGRSDVALVRELGKA